MSEIRVNATYHATKEELLKATREDIQACAMRSLAYMLSNLILDRPDVFEAKEVKDGGIRFYAECYVLTPDGFSELVEKIQRDLVRFGHTPMIGGVSF